MVVVTSPPISAVASLRVLAYVGARQLSVSLSTATLLQTRHKTALSGFWMPALSAQAPVNPFQFGAIAKRAAMVAENATNSPDSQWPYSSWSPGASLSVLWVAWFFPFQHIPCINGLAREKCLGETHTIETTR